MTISIKPTASGSTIEQDGSTILTVDGSGNITPSNGLYPKGPAFSAYLSADQSFSSGTWTKVALNVEGWDTNNCYDNTTNYRFTPNVAGYYQVNGHIGVYQPTQDLLVNVYKNGATSHWGTYLTRASGTTADMDTSISCMVYLNGTTDYIELYGYASGAAPRFYGLSSWTNRTYFQAHLVSV